MRYSWKQLLQPIIHLHQSDRYHSWLFTYRLALGLEWQRPSLLGLYVRNFLFLYIVSYYSFTNIESKSRYAGKLQRIERMLHHYGSSLNALPLLAQFRQTPSDTYLLRVAYGGITGPLSNVRADGSMYNAFHSFPDTLEGDAYSGDYGQNFLGVMLGSGTYVVHDPDVGLIAYGGNIAVAGNTVTVNPRDPVRRRIYVAVLGVYVTISAGQIDKFIFASNGQPGSVQLTIVPGVSGATEVIVWVETPGTTDTYSVTTAGGQRLRGGTHFDLPSSGLQVTVAKSK